ncbi:MAG TPA: hypothetical protein VM328_05620 [Fimbriimonadaceae bacterium]|jgi:hypothetical protein|nr:hypothetical protein [Fimbriimonadaceae bacterium]
MNSDLRRKFQRLAPSPTRHLDLASLVQEGRRRRRSRFVVYTTTTVVITIGAATALPVVFRDRAPDRNVGPVQTPTDNAAPSPDSAVPTPVFENLEAGWTELAPPPEPRTDAVTVWSGRQPSGRDLILWGGYSGFGGTLHNEGFSWNPATNSWTVIAESPLSPRAGAGAVFTGREIVIWGGYGQGERAFGDGAVYAPESDTWELLPDAPIGPAVPVAAVWTGEEVLIWGSTDRSAASREGASYNPSTNEWRRLPDAPAAINRGTAVWSGGDPEQRQEMIIFGAELDNNNKSELDHAVGIAYDPQVDTWRKLPDVALSPQASAIAWTGETVIAWDYGLSAAEYDRVTDRWREVPRVPLQDSECYPVTETIGSYVFAWFCGQAATWDFLDGGWQRVETPKQPVPGEPVAAGHVLIFAGATHESDHNSLWLWAPPSTGP